MKDYDLIIYSKKYKKVEKMPILCFGQLQSQWSYIQGQIKSFLYFIDPIFGHPVYQFLQKTDFSDFTFSDSGLPMDHRFRKYISLCWSNSYFMANARGRRVQQSYINSSYNNERL